MVVFKPQNLLLTTALAALVSVTAACSNDASTRSATKDTNASSTTVALVKAGAKVPAGTTLRIGDQLNYLQTVLDLSGQNKDLPYTVEYSSFIGGPPMLQAFQAGALDTGFVGSTPLIFAQAANQPISAVAQWASPGGGYQLVTAPGNIDIKGFADLKGKKVAYQEGTAGEAALLQALDKVGLKLSDVEPVLLPQTQLASALQGGSADAGLSVEPLTSGYLASNPTARVAGRAKELTDRSSFIIATTGALDDPAKQAALGDYIGRVVRGFNALQGDPTKVVQLFVKQYGLTPERAKALAAEIGVASFVPLPGKIVEPQQQLADLFQKAGQIPTKLDVSSEFDPRFNDIVAANQGGATSTTTTAGG
jgi:sulfonate transport system substrate-binding protein